MPSTRCGAPQGDENVLDLYALQNCQPMGDENNRCSSNSNQGPGTQGGDRWSADTGLSNAVSWAAQFALRHNIGIADPIGRNSRYANWAVSGASPEDWAPGGRLNSKLEEVVRSDPD